jgi:ABC-2 type transport system permease protein
MANRLLALWKIPFLIFKNRFLQRRKKIKTYLMPFATLVFFLMLFLFARQMTVSNLSSHDDSQLLVSLQFGGLAIMCMLFFSNFATGLQGFYGAFDIPYLLALPITRTQLLLGRAATTIWNASWSSTLFCLPLAFGYLLGVGATPIEIILSLTSLILLTILSGLMGILFATLFVNLVPTSRMLEFFIVLLVFFILCVATLAPDIGPSLPSSSQKLVELSNHIKANPQSLLDGSPAGMFGVILANSRTHAPILYSFLGLVSWTVLTFSLTSLAFNYLFLRGWNLTFAGKPRQKIVEIRAQKTSKNYIDQQLRAIMTKELKMFVRDPAQAVQFLVILLLTFLYLFNLKNLRNLSFAEEEGAYWWQAVLGLANVSMGGCVAAAMATRFVFPSVSLEGKAYPLLIVTPMEVPKLLYAKCVAWFWPTCLVNSVLLISGGMALQLPPLALVYTLLVSIALSLGLVGLGVGMGAIYAKFDWDQRSSINSSLGALLYMIFSFVLIMVSLLPTGFLFITACIPSFTSKVGLGMTIGPILVALTILVLINLLVARGSLKSGVERLREVS